MSNLLPPVKLLLGTDIWEGWTTIDVERSFEDVSGGFQLIGVDRWPGGERGVEEGEQCSVSLDGRTVITGYVDFVGCDIDPDQHIYQVQGRDRTEDLVDCSVVGRSQWVGRTLLQIAQDVCKPFGISVTSQVPLKPLSRVNVDVGETAFELLDRLAKHVGVLLVSDGLGGLRIINPTGGAESGQLVEGENLVNLSLSSSWRDRHSVYIVRGQSAAADDNVNVAAATHRRAEVRDPGINRYRPLVVIADEQGVDLQARAQWECNVRRGRGAQAQARVDGWGPSSGEVWTPGDLVGVRSPRTGFYGQLQISRARYRLDGTGLYTMLALVDPLAFSATAGARASAIGRALTGRNGATETKRGDRQTRKVTK